LNFFRWIKENIPLINRDKVASNEHVDLENLQETLGFTFHNNEYYLKALTHRSFLEISPKFIKSNERLEFLGDSILGVVVAESLFKKFPDKDEGFLTKYRSHLVNRQALVSAAGRINLLEFVLYDKRYVRGSKAGQKTIVADCFEALIGAIYLDAGLEEAREFIYQHILSPNYSSGQFTIDKNYKGQLLEFTHQHKLAAPFYKIMNEDGPDHDKKFSIDVLIGGKSYGKGVGSNKKTAEQQAAEYALKKLTEEYESNQ
jgi:ribonuclease-3